MIESNSIHDATQDSWQLNANILLVVPNQLVKNFPSIDIPLGVLSIAAYLRAHEYSGSVDIYDATVSGNIWEDDQGRTFLGDTPEEIAKRIKDSGANMIGISNMFTWQYQQALLVAKICKTLNSELTTVIGGPHASAFPKETIEEPDIDFVVMGEGEHRLLELARALDVGAKPEIQGVLQSVEDMDLLKPSRRSRISFLPELDDLPIPAYDMVDMERYFYLQRKGYSSRPRSKGNRSVSMLTSRGCPHQCVFCSIQATMGYKWRHNSADYVKRHLVHLIDHYQIDYVHFEDDNFTHDPSRYEEIIDVLLQLPKSIRWDTPNGVRGDTWTLDLVKKTRRSGCQYLIVAIESGVQRVIDEVVKKRLDLGKVDDLMRFCKLEGLKLFAFYVIGLPGETKDDLQATMNYALEKFQKYDVLPTINKIKTLPGTELHEIVSEGKFYGDEMSDEENTLYTPEFNPQLIDGLFAKYFRRLMVIAFIKGLTKPVLMASFFRLLLAYRWYFKSVCIRMFKAIFAGISFGKISGLTHR